MFITTDLHITYHCDILYGFSVQVTSVANAYMTSFCRMPSGVSPVPTMVVSVNFMASKGPYMEIQRKLLSEQDIAQSVKHGNVCETLN